MPEGGERRTDRSSGFDAEQRIWLMERDLDQFEQWIRSEFDTQRQTLRRISTACIAILTALCGSLILLVVQARGL